MLVPITLLGVTLIVFTLTRFMPGSPIERAMQRDVSISELEAKRESELTRKLKAAAARRAA